VQYNILLVDDNPQNLAALSKILSERGYHLRTAINGQVALTSVRNMLPDLVLLDILMPGMDGYEVCRQLKADKTAHDVPVLFLSALDAPLDKVKAFEAGGVDYITKPFQADEVVARVDTHLALRGMQQQLQAQNQELATYRDHLEELVQQRTRELTREVAEREHAEQAIRVSEQQYRSLAAHVKDGIVIVQHGHIVFVNPVFTSMLRCSRDSLLHQSPLQLFPEHIRKKAQEWLASCQAASTDTPEWQVELLLADGRTLWTEIGNSHIVWDSQSALLLTIRDVHEGKIRELRLEEERSRLHQENQTFKSSLMERFRFGQLVGKSPAMQRVYQLIISAAASDVNTLIVGESGTGKELIARTIHQVSARKNQPFVAVNCASIPETLFEREFFGHRKGAFTSADRDKPGFFDRAHRGVLFLDEVTELTPGMQAKLLRVLQDGEYIPLGDSQPKQADVLLVTATNTQWNPLIEKGVLREDFFYRVCVIEIRVPSLQERKEDLPLLVDHFLQHYRCKQRALPENIASIPTTLPGHILESLYAYHWPGNVRELQNVLQRYLATHHLDAEIPLLTSSADHVRTRDFTTNSQHLPLPEAIKAFEKQMITEALRQNQHHKINTAKMLGIPRSTLHRKIKEYQLQDSDIS
jgi:PAS domain S-box-containing protein